MSRFALLLFTMMAVFALTGAAHGEINCTVDGQSAIAADSQNPDVYLEYAQWLVDREKFEDACNILEVGRNKAHPSAELLVTLGKVYEKRQMIARSEALTREALALDADYVPAHLRLGEIYFALGWPKSGLDCFRQAVALAPDESLPRVKLVGGLLEAGQVPLAEDQCLEFLASYGDDPNLWLGLGQVFEKQGKHQEAFTTYGQALVLDPNLSAAYARRGRLFCEFSQFDAAAESCRKALELNQDDALAHAYLGIACSYLGDTDEARKHAQMAETAGLNMTAVWKKIGH